jgi:hypothetical protein
MILSGHHILAAKGVDACTDPLIIGGHNHPGKQLDAVGTFNHVLYHRFAVDQGKRFTRKSI